MPGLTDSIMLNGVPLRISCDMGLVVVLDSYTIRMCPTELADLLNEVTTLPDHLKRSLPPDARTVGLGK